MQSPASSLHAELSKALKFHCACGRPGTGALGILARPPAPCPSLSRLAAKQAAKVRVDDALHMRANLSSDCPCMVAVRFQQRIECALCYMAGGSGKDGAQSGRGPAGQGKHGPSGADEGKCGKAASSGGAQRKLLGSELPSWQRVPSFTLSAEASVTGELRAQHPLATLSGHG